MAFPVSSRKRWQQETKVNYSFFSLFYYYSLSSYSTRLYAPCARTTCWYQHNFLRITASFSAGSRYQLVPGVIDMLLLWCSWFWYRFIKCDFVTVGKFCFYRGSALGGVDDWTLRPHYTREIWKRSFIFKVRPTVHTNPHENGAFRKRPSNRRNLKRPALRFSMHRKRWHHDNHVIALTLKG